MGNVVLYVDNEIILIRDKQHFVSVKKGCNFLKLSQINVHISSCGFKLIIEMMCCCLRFKSRSLSISFIKKRMLHNQWRIARDISRQVHICGGRALLMRIRNITTKHAMSTRTLRFVFLWEMEYVYMGKMFAKDASKWLLNKLLKFSSKIDFCAFFFFQSKR